MFTLAHELAHLMLGSSAIFDLRELQPADDPVEQVCNQLAAEFLVPEDEMREIWPDICKATECFQEVARRFKVSELVAVRRALDLKLITKPILSSIKHLKQNDIVLIRIKVAVTYATQNMRVGRRFAEAVVQRQGRASPLSRSIWTLRTLW